MKPHTLYVGPLKALRPLVLCACGKLITDGYDWCSEACAEAHHKGDLPAKEPCTCSGELRTIRAGRMILRMGHLSICPRYVAHPEDFTHPMENA